MGEHNSNTYRWIDMRREMRVSLGFEAIQVILTKKFAMNLLITLLLTGLCAIYSFRFVGTHHLRHVHTASSLMQNGMTTKKSSLEQESIFFGVHDHLELEVVGKSVQEEKKSHHTVLARSVLPLIAVGASFLSFNTPALANVLESTTSSLGNGKYGDGGFLQSFLLIFISEIGIKLFLLRGY